MDALLDQKFELAVTTDILLEYHEIISARSHPIVADNIVSSIVRAPNVVRTSVKYRWNLITADPDDNKFVDCAISARVRFVVTNDKHFDILKKIDFPLVEVISLDDFLKEVEAL